MKVNDITVVINKMRDRNMDRNTAAIIAESYLRHHGGFSFMYTRPKGWKANVFQEYRTIVKIPPQRIFPPAKPREDIGPLYDGGGIPYEQASPSYDKATPSYDRYTPVYENPALTTYIVQSGDHLLVYYSHFQDLLRHVGRADTFVISNPIHHRAG